MLQNARTAVELQDALLAESDDNARAILVVWQDPNRPTNPGRIVVLHGIKRYSPTLGAPSTPWDDNIFCWFQDVVDGSPPTTLEFQVGAFYIAEPTLDRTDIRIYDAPTLARMYAADPTLVIAATPGEGTAGTGIITTRNSFPLPFRYVAGILNRNTNPRDVFEAIYSQIVSEGRVVEMQPLINWLCAACTVRHDQGAGQLLVSVAMETWPVPPADMELRQHRQKLLHAKFSPPNTQGASLNLLGHLVNETRLSQLDAQDPASVTKTPKTYYGPTLESHLRRAQVSTEGELTAEALPCPAVPVKDSSHELSSISTATSGSNAAASSSSPGTSPRLSIMEMTPTSVVFDLLGTLEYILSYSEAIDLLVATQVNRRWKEAGRTDSLWAGAMERLWKRKIGAYFQQPRPQQQNGSCAGDSSSAVSSSSSPPPLFWRSLFTKDAVRRMTAAQIRTIFQHPLLSEKRELLDKKQITEKADLQRFLQVHMFDVISDGPGRPRFFSDIYFGSYACSVMDSKRDSITPLELCTPSGFDTYVTSATVGVPDADRSFYTSDEEGDGTILLYHHSTCSFKESREFSMVLQPVLQPYVRIPFPDDLRWRWLDFGKRLQVGPYPPLVVSRRKDWGWKLENLHFVLFFRA